MTALLPQSVLQQKPSAQKLLAHSVAAAQAFGWDNRFKLDPLTVSMAHPDAMAAILTGKLEVKTHAATVPFLFQELADPRVRTVLSSYDVAGGRHTLIVAYNTEKWKTENPRSYAAVAAGLEEAMGIIARDKRAAAELYVRVEKPKLTVDEVHAMLQQEDKVYFSAAPSRMMVWAEFMHKNGTLKNLPASWKEFFWENVHDKPGS